MAATIHYKNQLKLAETVKGCKIHWGLNKIAAILEKLFCAVNQISVNQI